MRPIEAVDPRRLGRCYPTLRAVRPIARSALDVGPRWPARFAVADPRKVVERQDRGIAPEAAPRRVRPRSRRSPIMGQIHACDDGSARLQPQQPRAKAQKRRLSGAIRGLKQHDRPRVDGEIDPRKNRKTPRDGNSSFERNDGDHGRTNASATLPRRRRAAAAPCFCGSQQTSPSMLS